MLGRCLSKSPRHRPNLTKNAGPTSTDVAPNSPTSFKHREAFARLGPASVRFLSESRWSLTARRRGRQRSAPMLILNAAAPDYLHESRLHRCPLGPICGSHQCSSSANFDKFRRGIGHIRADLGRMQGKSSLVPERRPRKQRFTQRHGDKTRRHEESDAYLITSPGS